MHVIITGVAGGMGRALGIYAHVSFSTAIQLHEKKKKKINLAVF
jgi:hypothetical protein